MWFPPQKEAVVIKKDKLAFKAVAVAAAIDCKGVVVAKRVVDGAIDSDQFIIFLEELADYTGNSKCLLLVDNLPVHRTGPVVRYAESKQIELLYNATYSSTFNPIERLWAWSKQRFSRMCIDGAPYHNQGQMRRLVSQVVSEDYTVGLRKHIDSCLKNMQIWLDSEKSKAL